jgi:hypothetical protein
MSSVENNIASGKYDVNSQPLVKGCDHEMEPNCLSCQSYYSSLLELQNAELNALEQFKHDALTEVGLIDKKAVRDKVFEVAKFWASKDDRRTTLTETYAIMKDVAEVVNSNTSAFDQTFSSLTIPLLDAAADALAQFPVVILQAGGSESIYKLLDSAAKISTQLRDTSNQMKKIQGRTAAPPIGGDGSLVGAFERVELLQWLGTLPPLKPIAKCRLPEGGSLELVLYYKADVLQVNEEKVFKNAFDEQPTPAWLVQCLEALSKIFKQREWMPVSNSQFMQAVGGILRGWT